MSTAPELVAAHKKALIDLATLTDRDLLRIWRMVSGSSADDIRDALLEMLPAVGAEYSDMAASIGADFYEDVRDEAVARGSFVAEPAPAPGTARFEALARWGVDPLYSLVPDEALTFIQIAGGLQRIVADQARQTVEFNSLHDPAAYGWRRVTSSGACKFCRMLAGRGEVYSKGTVRFASHDNCGCAAAPAFDSARPITVDQYAASKRRQSDADKARVRAFMANMDGAKASPGSVPTKASKPEVRRPAGFDAMSRQQIEKQISILEGLKDSDYKAAQLSKLRARLADLPN